jgi:hypothetical protein
MQVAVGIDAFLCAKLFTRRARLRDTPPKMMAKAFNSIGFLADEPCEGL